MTIITKLKTFLSFFFKYINNFGDKNKIMIKKKYRERKRREKNSGGEPYGVEGTGYFFFYFFYIFFNFYFCAVKLTSPSIPPVSFLYLFLFYFILFLKKKRKISSILYIFLFFFFQIFFWRFSIATTQSPKMLGTATSSFFILFLAPSRWLKLS